MAMMYQVKYSMHPDGPFVERDGESLKQEFLRGQIKSDTMVRLTEWDPWIPLTNALNLSLSATEGSTAGGGIKIKCLKCSGDMVAGFILDLGDRNRHMLSRWVAGTPERSFWRGIKTDDKEQYDVQTYRCRKCGFLESYAPRR